jgi:hypothetical protein
LDSEVVVGASCCYSPPADRRAAGYHVAAAIATSLEIFLRFLEGVGLC